jgi:hypothetical protein
LKINAEYERLSRPIQFRPRITESFTKLLKCGRLINGKAKMAYTVTSDDTAGLAIGPVSEETNDVHDALNKARQMYETGLVNVSIKDEAGHRIDGDELLACITGKKTITNDLQAK